MARQKGKQTIENIKNHDKKYYAGFNLNQLKECTWCKTQSTYKNYFVNKETLDGFENMCKLCNKGYTYEKIIPDYIISRRALNLLRNIKFHNSNVSVTKEDIIRMLKLPDPLSGQLFDFTPPAKNKKVNPNAPKLDKKDYNKDYTPENTQVITFINNQKFVQQAKLVPGHENNDYSQCEYTGWNCKITVICMIPGHPPYIQNANDHLKGNGCPMCSASKGESKIYQELTNAGVKFEKEKKFDDFIIKDTGGYPRYDVWCPEENWLIEYQGEQHYKNIAYFRGGLKKRKAYDKLKREYARKNGIKLLIIRYDNKDIPGTLKRAGILKPKIIKTGTQLELFN